MTLVEFMGHNFLVIYHSYTNLVPNERREIFLNDDMQFGYTYIACTDLQPIIVPPTPNFFLRNSGFLSILFNSVITGLNMEYL